jgi:hypothetical protein
MQRGVHCRRSSSSAQSGPSEEVSLMFTASERLHTYGQGGDVVKVGQALAVSTRPASS